MPEEKKPEEDKVITSENYTQQEMVIHDESTKWLKDTELEVKPVSASEVKDIVVVASNPQQMQTAQANLVEHFTGRLKSYQQDLQEAETNLETAKSRRWKTEPFKRQIARVNQHIEYYAKIRAALMAGYVIIPNMDDLDIFAIRTTRKKPKANIAKGGSSWVEPPERQKSSKPAMGEGRYVNADTLNETWAADVTPAGATTKQVQMRSKAVYFDDIDFPFHLAKPQILDSTAKAMELLAFDDIGVRPGRRIKRGDPMIVGRVLLGSGYSQKIVSFLITWFVDTKDL